MVNSLDDAMAAGADACKAADSDEIMIIGGAQIYQDCLPIADKLYLTRLKLKSKVMHFSQKLI